MNDPVNHPKGYTSHPSGIEVIEYTRLLPFDPGNAVKYVMRRDHKGTPLQDLDKALWYLNDCVENGISYRITVKMVDIVKDVINAEPNYYVRMFLVAMYIPERGLGLRRRPNIRLAQAAARAIREGYVDVR